MTPTETSDAPLSNDDLTCPEEWLPSIISISYCFIYCCNSILHYFPQSCKISRLSDAIVAALTLVLSLGFNYLPVRAFNTKVITENFINAACFMVPRHLATGSSRELRELCAAEETDCYFFVIFQIGRKKLHL